MRGLVPSHVTCQSCQFRITAHLLLYKQHETIQNQSRLEAIAETSECPMQTLTLGKITPRDIIPEINPSLKDSEKNIGWNQQEAIQVLDNALQTLIESLLIEDWDLCINPAAKEHTQPVIAPHWLPSTTSSHALAWQHDKCAHKLFPRPQDKSIY